MSRLYEKLRGKMNARQQKVIARMFRERPGRYLVLDHVNSLPNKLPAIYLRLPR